MIELLANPEIWIAFFTLTALELVLGIDNIIFISILVDKLPQEQREIARRIGLFLAMFMRIALLLLLSWIVGLTAPLFSLFGYDVSGRDGFGHHVPKGYIYFAMAFSVCVEMLNIRVRKKAAQPVELREPYVRETVG